MRRHSEFEEGYHNEKIEGNERKIHKLCERLSEMTMHYPQFFLDWTLRQVVIFGKPGMHVTNGPRVLQLCSAVR